MTKGNSVSSRDAKMFVVKEYQIRKWVVRPLCKQLRKQHREAAQQRKRILNRIQFLEDLIEIIAREIGRQGERNRSDA